MNSFYRHLAVLYCAKENPKTLGLTFEKGYLECGGHIGLRTTFEVENTPYSDKVRGAFAITPKVASLEMITNIIISHKNFDQQYIIKGISDSTKLEIQEYYKQIIAEQWLRYYN